jgi:hypothetical protein
LPFGTTQVRSVVPVAVLVIVNVLVLRDVAVTAKPLPFGVMVTWPAPLPI